MHHKIPWNLIISKLRDDGLSVESQNEFAAWISLGENEHLFTQLEIVWKNIQHKTADYEPDMEYYWTELSARVNQMEAAEKTGESSRNKNLHISFKHFYRVAAVAVVLLLGSFYGFYFLGKKEVATPSITQTYTSVNGKSKITLPEGSEVWLHSNTTLSYNYNPKKHRREAVVLGEAYFDVRKNKAIPFVVSTGDVEVKVLGTQFNVNSYDPEKDIVVSLYEGSIQMTVNDKKLLLKPGEEGNYNKTNNTLTLHEENEGFARSWTAEQLRFENKNLRYVCLYLEKWYGVRIEIDPHIPDNQFYTFTLRGESLEDVVRIMAKIHSFKYQFNENNTLALKK